MPYLKAFSFRRSKWEFKSTTVTHLPPRYNILSFMFSNPSIMSRYLLPGVNPSRPLPIERFLQGPCSPSFFHPFIPSRLIPSTSHSSIMMYALIVLSTVVSCATAFSTLRMAADGMSASIPFLKAPKNLEGVVVCVLPHVLIIYQI